MSSDSTSSDEVGAGSVVNLNDLRGSWFRLPLTDAEVRVVSGVPATLMWRRAKGQVGDKCTGVTATYGIDWMSAETSERLAQDVKALVVDMLLDETSRTEGKQRIATVSELPTATVNKYGDEAYLYMLGQALTKIGEELTGLTRAEDIIAHAEVN